MTRLIALVLIICALIATTAFANTFAVNTGADAGQADISSGSGTVNACNDAIKVDLIGGDWNASEQDYDLDSVAITTDSKDCIGDVATVDLLDANYESLGSGTGTIDGDGNANISISGVLVGPVHHVAVMIDTP